jgi:hypothetical protein
MGKKIKCKRCDFEGAPSTFSYKIGKTEDGVPIHKLKDLCPVCVLDGIETLMDSCEETNDE